MSREVLEKIKRLHEALPDGFVPAKPGNGKSIENKPAHPPPPTAAHASADEDPKTGLPFQL